MDPLLTASRRLVWILLLGALLVALTSAPVGAHAALDRSDPAANAVLSTPPTQVQLLFTERLERSSSRAELYDQTGTLVPNATSRAGDGPKAMVLDVPTGLPNGTYSVVWRNLSLDDGHTAQGYFAFTIGTVADVRAVVPPLAATTGPPDWLRIASRWLALLGLAAAVAVWPVWLFVLRPAVTSVWQIGPALTRRVRRWATAALALALAGSLVALLVQAAGVGDGAYVDRLMTTLADTRYGRLWLLRVALFVAYGCALALCAWWWPWRRPWLTGGTLALAALLPLPFSLNAHASALSSGRATAVAFDVAHLLGAAIWVGGLFLLVGGLLPTLRDLTPAGRRMFLARVVPRFSALALAAWAVLGITGLYSAWLQVGNLAGLRDTAYGHSLALKLLMLVPLLALAAVNLLVMPRRLRPSTDDRAATTWSRRFGMVVAAEAVLVIAVLLVVGRLIGQPPAREVLAQRANQLSIDLAGEGRTATLAIAPGAAGPNHYRLDVGGAPLPPEASAVVRLSLPGRDIGEKQVDLARVAGNAFEAHGSELSIAGDWTLTAIVRTPGASDWRATHALAIGATPPTGDVPRPAWRFGPGGLVGLLCLVLGIAAVALAWVVGRGPLRRETATLGGIALVAGLFLLLQARIGSPAAAGDASLANPVPASAASIARGKETFLANCAACHGAGGKGDGPAAAGLPRPPADFTAGHSSHHTDAELFRWIENGIPGSGMPAFGETLSDDQIWDVINHLRSLDAGAATPEALPDALPGADTPVTRSGLTVTMLPPTGPPNAKILTVSIADATGAPVEGAAVTATTTSLAMAMGSVTSEMSAVAPGQYQAADVPMSMAGAWRVEVRIGGTPQGEISVPFGVTVETAG